MKKLFASSLFLSTVFGLLGQGSLTYASCGSREQCQAQIQEYESKLKEIKQEKTGLSSQIKLMNTQLSLTATKIDNTESLIDTTKNEIEALGGKIEDLNSSLDTLSAILLHKIVEGYKDRNVSLFSFLLNPVSASADIQKSHYVDAARKSDQLLALKLQQSKYSYEEQKTKRESKILELQDLERELVQQKAALDNQKIQKQALLTQTNNEESKYQQLLDQALAEFQAVERATATGQKVGPVKKGDPIAIMGNTGYPYCSTGKHLHFEVRRGGTWVDPNSYLSSGWSHPLSDPVNVTQGFGTTPWSWRYTYSGGIHTGLDMTSGSSDVIRAPADGILYSSSQACRSAVIKIKYIDHGDGLISYYLHVTQ